MKTILISISLLICFGAYSQNANTKDMKTFCTEFSETILAGDLNKAMEYLDKDYVKTQHDGMLEGRTNQFFEELLSGTDKKKDFVAPAIKDISSMKVTKIKHTKDSGYEVKFSIEIKNGTKLTTVLNLIIIEDDGMALVGAVG